MSNKNIGAIKLAGYQKEAKDMVMEFRQHLQRHFDIVYAKTKKLIDTRWEDNKNVINKSGEIQPE